MASARCSMTSSGPVSLTSAEWFTAITAMNDLDDVGHAVWSINQESQFPHSKVMCGYSEPINHVRTKIPRGGER